MASAIVRPLLLVVVASPAAFASRAWGGRARGILASLLALAILAAAITRFRGFRPNLVDCPELAGLLVDSLTFEAVCASGIVALALWAWAPRAGARAYLFACVPLIAAAGTFHINAALRNRLAPDVYDRAGTFAKQYLRETERPKVLVVGSNAGEAYRALFHLDSPPAAIRVIAEGTSFDLAQMPAGKEWALVVGDHALVGQPLFALDRDGYRLVHAAATLAIDFRQAAWPGIIAAVSGLSQAEPWGRWSSADIVTLTIVAPLPPRFTLHLRGRALGPNVGAGIVARVGDSAATFALAAAIEDRELVLDNPERANTLSISVPHPVVPKDVGIGEDSRRLGVGLVELRVVPR